MSANPATRNLPNAYTDAPELHPNLILGSLHLVGWLFFHPTAWRNHVARVDPTLSPDFAVIELNRAQWRNPAVRRLVFQGSVFWALLLGLLVGIGQWITGQPAGDVVYHVALIMTGILASSITLSLGPTLAMIVGGGLPFVVVSAIAGDLGYRTGSASFGIMGSVLVSLISQERALSFTRQIGGIVVGFLAGSVASGIILGLAFLTAKAPASIIVSGLVFGLAGGLGFILLGKWRACSWHRRTVIGVAVGAAVVGMASGRMYNLVPGEITSVVSNLVDGALTGLTFSMWWSIIFALAFVLAERITGPWVGGIASTLCMGEIYLLVQTFFL